MRAVLEREVIQIAEMTGNRSERRTGYAESIGRRQPWKEGNGSLGKGRAGRQTTGTEDRSGGWVGGQADRLTEVSVNIGWFCGALGPGCRVRLTPRSRADGCILD